MTPSPSPFVIPSPVDRGAADETIQRTGSYLYFILIDSLGLISDLNVLFSVCRGGCCRCEIGCDYMRCDCDSDGKSSPGSVVFCIDGSG